MTPERPARHIGLYPLAVTQDIDGHHLAHVSIAGGTAQIAGLIDTFAVVTQQHVAVADTGAVGGGTGQNPAHPDLVGSPDGVEISGMGVLVHALLQFLESLAQRALFIDKATRAEPALALGLVA